MQPVLLCLVSSRAEDEKTLRISRWFADRTAFSPGAFIIRNRQGLLADRPGPDGDLGVAGGA